MLSKIQNIVKELIQKIGTDNFDLDVENKDGNWSISINTPDERSLVGKEGEKFEALSHLIKRIIVKICGDDVRVVVDVNNMRSKNEEALKAKASMIAERAKSFKINIEMDPMSSYERMLIHSHLEGKPNIKTESIGEGRDRRLVIKYIEESRSDPSSF